ncbi:MAG: 16S rRNA (uracil(1498)-N(3))-methyltransferase [Planctomycetota bacterium]|nr:16S rRNA (uracil(1498)-N(3))-methyltransferase [Planctomycetota bacterium]
MSKPRRFKVESLASLEPGASVLLSPEESKHARVLRLEAGTVVELFDGSGLAWRARLEPNGMSAELLAPLSGSTPERAPLWLATAWPKGKRAAILIEKCAELGVARILPLRCARSVVTKDAGGEGLARLRRVAAEATKQCGRRDVPQLDDERSFGAVLAEEAPRAHAVLLDPGADRSWAEFVRERRTTAEPFLVFVGPEGGFSNEERRVVEQAGIPRARLGEHILRVETACIAACAAWNCQ